MARTSRKISLTSTLREAHDFVANTLRDGDSEKWLAYQALSKKEQLEWRRGDGMGEFIRLQRLAYHSFI